MLTLAKLSKSYAGRLLFEDVSLQVNRTERIGLVGPNGAGKSTLFSLIRGDLTADSGSVSYERGVNIGFLPQETAPVGDETVIELALGAVPGSDLSQIDDYTREPRAKRILRGLAFRETDFDRPLRSLSGGWVMRAHLARLLVQEPDLLLLDEPTNHLDLESLVWFQNHLLGYSGAILAVSHDREFLNTLCQWVVDIRHQRLARYRGNYDAYLVQVAARDEQLRAASENQGREIDRLQRFVDRFGAKASKAAQAQSRVKMIERLQENRVRGPEAADRKVRFRFPQPPRGGQRSITLAGVHFAYGENVIYSGISTEIERGERIVLVGPNGAGKSTLLKLLAGVLEHQKGERVLGHNVVPGYFAQSRSEMKLSRRTVLEEASDLPEQASEQAIRTVLGCFLFSGDDVFKPVAVLSGGEKSRLALAKLLLNPPNLLLLDEPTTHLDMASIDALIGALQSYEGTLVFISHDVHFIRNVANRVLHISGGVLTPYAGDYQYYLDRTGALSARAGTVASLTDSRAGAATSTSAPAASSAPGAPAVPLTLKEQKEQRRREADARQAEAKAKREHQLRLATLENDIASLEDKQRALCARLEDPANANNFSSLFALNKDLEEIQATLEQKTKLWETLSA